MPPGARRRYLLAVAATLALLVPLGWAWASSLVPGTYSVMEMGYADLGHGEGPLQHAAAPPSADVRDASTLTGPQDGEPDVAVRLVARKETVHLAGGPALAGYTLNHSSPGPEIRAVRGDLVEVTLVNESVPDGVTLHWHGVDVPNAEDGVAGVTQDAVATGGEHVYRFVVEDAGTYWYHSHQVSHEQVRQGLFGVFVVAPPEPADILDVVAAVHSFDGRRTVGGRMGESRVEAEPGAPVRVRVVNTDDGGMRTWVAGTAYRVVAVDGRDVNAPTDLQDTSVLVTAGGRVDLELRVPDDGTAVRVGAGGGQTSLVVGPTDGEVPGTDVPEAELDLLSYGSPAPSGIDVDHVDRELEYRIGRRPGFLDGRPGLWWTVNARLFPDVPMYVVSQGDVVRMTVENSSGQVHPMHLHGHHALVLSRNGVAATGSPWWVDTLDVADGETYEIAFVADNPGTWMFHCHNLPHAAQGLVAHLAYDDVSTPFLVGGAAANSPE
jgi:FtsP/CotA-like multicopper oxidase with cupredoxin domain